MQKTKNEATLPENYIDVKTNFEAYAGKEPFLFVSYSHRNIDKVYPLLDKLHEKKFRIWYDESCETGNDFRDELREKIERCSGVLLFVSEASMSSPFCGMEIIVARENKKRVYPIFLDNSPIPPAFQILLANTHHGSISNIPKLLKALERDLPPETMDRLTIENDRLKSCENNGSEIEVDNGIRVICANAFKNRDQLKSISLPDSLERIETEAFRACSNLESLVVPEKVTHIGDSAFRDCIKLKSLTILNGAIKIGERAFENCPELTEVILPETLMEIYGSVFNGCKKLKTIKLPENLTVIGENAFADCVSLEKIDLPSSIIKIDDLVFSGCTSLKQVNIQNGIKKIGKAAFKNCRSLSQVFIPVSVTYLSTDLFRGCESLRSIRVDPKNKYYKSEPNKRDGNEHVLFNKNKSEIIAYPANSREVQYDIPDSVTIISDWAFSEGKFTRISIPDSVTQIGENAFCDCSRLDRCEIPDSVTSIDDCAFRGCSTLEKILIPSSVQDLGWGVFDGCPDNLVIYCEEGSKIQDYCRRMKIKDDRISAFDNN